MTARQLRVLGEIYIDIGAPPVEVRELRNHVNSLAQLRNSLVHGNSPAVLTYATLDTDIDDSWGWVRNVLTAARESEQWSAGLQRAVEWCRVHRPHDIPANPSLTISRDETMWSGQWSPSIGIEVGVADHAQWSGGFCSRLLPGTLYPSLARLESVAALVRLLDGILAALCLLLVLVLTAVTRRPDGLIYVLIMLAACLHYGHRGEPDDRSFLHLRQKRCPGISLQT
jgi:hypothetical protein